MTTRPTSSSTTASPTAPTPPAATATVFSGYQKKVVGMLAFLQFAVILDFMLMSPLGAMIMPSMAISAKQFGLVVSAYAFSAGLSGLLTAGFADRYDRKKLLLFFYSGFILGTVWCGMAQTYEMLFAARIVTGLFGGVIGSIVLAISTDIFAPQLRGRVMGMIQTAFAASQVLGLPFGLYLSNRWNWHIPFFVLAFLGLIGGLIVLWQMKPVNAHLAIPQEHSAWKHLLHTVTEPRYLLAFAAVSFLQTGGFMLMPFGSTFVVNNLGISIHQLPTLYVITGICTIFIGPIVGKVSDAVGKFKVFIFGTLLSMLIVAIYTNLQSLTFPLLVVVNVLLFVGIFSRMIPVQAMMASVPTPVQRGSFSAISASIQQLSGGIASVIAGHLVRFDANGKLLHYETLGHVVIGTSIIAFCILWRLQHINARAAVETASRPA